MLITESLSAPFSVKTCINSMKLPPHFHNATGGARRHKKKEELQSSHIITVLKNKEGSRWPPLPSMLLVHMENVLTQLQDQIYKT